GDAASGAHYHDTRRLAARAGGRHRRQAENQAGGATRVGEKDEGHSRTYSPFPRTGRLRACLHVSVPGQEPHGTIASGTRTTCPATDSSTGSCSSPNSPSHRAITAVARQLPTRLIDVRAMSISASTPRITATPCSGRPNEASAPDR